jgi:hypothetical protein
MFINLTPHPIVLQYPTGQTETISASGSVAVVDNLPGEREQGQPFPVYGPDRPGEVKLVHKDGRAPGEMPLPGADTYIVSALAGAALRGRPDVVVPGTGPLDECVRDGQGRIVAVTRLKRP